MGRLLGEKGLLPDLILSSPAKRALKTAKLIAEELGYPKKDIAIRESIYEQDIRAMIGLIGELDDKLKRVFLIGHNPVITELANRLTGGGIHDMPTCSIVSIEFSLPAWKQCAIGVGDVALFERPAKAKPTDDNGEELPSDDILGT